MIEGKNIISIGASVAILFLSAIILVGSVLNYITNADILKGIVVNTQAVLSSVSHAEQVEHRLDRTIIKIIQTDEENSRQIKTNKEQLEESKRQIEELNRIVEELRKIKK